MTVLKVLMILIPYIGSFLSIFYFITYNILYAYSVSVAISMFITALFFIISFQIYEHGPYAELETKVELGELLRTIVFFLLAALVFLDITLLNVKLIAQEV